MNQRFLLASTLALFAAAPAAAQIVPVGPFTGDYSESFETQAAQGQSGFTPCMIGRIFQNTADMCTPGSSGIHITGGWSFGCQIQERTGTWLHGTASGTGTEITFDQAVGLFGSYFGNNTPNAGQITVDFYNGASFVGSAQFPQPNDCQWYWQGWSIAGGADRIVITNSNYSGAFVMMEDLEASVDGGGGGLGTNYCGPANVNSSGASGQISASGSDVASDGNLTLSANQLPQNEFGYFLCSRTTGFIPNVGGGQGNFCLAIPFGRFLSGLQSTGAGGTMQHVVDMNNMPNSIPAQVLAGDTWYFQAWFRDTNPGQTSNLTDGIEILFL